jgi:hypothetical protein
MPQVDYNKTLIYKIQHKEKDELLYVGSTTHFRNRKVQHKHKCYNPNGRAYNYKLYQTIRDNGGWDVFSMVVIKEFPCKNKQEALTEEERVMRQMKSSLNMIRAYTTHEEKKEYNKKHYEKNKDKIKEYDKQKYEKNKEKIKEQKKEYREQNRDKVNEQKRQYYNENRVKILEENKLYRELNPNKTKEGKKRYYLNNIDKIKEKNKEKINCQCGCAVIKYNLARHKRSIKHQTLINQQTDQ